MKGSRWERERGGRMRYSAAPVVGTYGASRWETDPMCGGCHGRGTMMGGMWHGGITAGRHGECDLEGGMVVV
ncbi:sulfite exporter TauE/SafE family protein [Sesbania bispinosa]|nr:sulfite exporter TauE/SafE family protein [Sesbania bispinosa]